MYLQPQHQQPKANSTTMSQIEASDVIQSTHSTYEEYIYTADTFDLSLLSMGSEINGVPHLSQQQQPQRISPSQSPDYISTTIFEAINGAWVGNQQQQQTDLVSTQELSKSPTKPISITGPVNTLTPPQEKFLTIFPPSPTPSIEFGKFGCSNNNSPIKKEQNCKIAGNNFLGLYPLSPPDSNGAPSPHQYSDIKNEPFDISCTESSIDIDSFFQSSFELATKTILTPSTSPSSSSSSSPSSVYSGGSDIPTHLSPSIDLVFGHATSSCHVDSEQTTLDTPKKDHQLLREYLQDNTFQKKHNLKPLALESLFVDENWDVRGDIEPVISLALEHARKDIHQTCVTLNISSDPQQWSRNQVQQWLQFTLKQFKLPSIQNIEHIFTEDGRQLSCLNEIDFINRIPLSGATLFAQLEIWKAANCCDNGQMFVDNDMAQQQQQQPVDQLCGLQTWISSMDCDSIDDSFNTDEKNDLSPTSSYDCAPIPLDPIQVNISSSPPSVNIIASANGMAATNVQQQQQIDQQTLIKQEPETSNENEQTNKKSNSSSTTPNSGASQKTGNGTRRQGSSHIHLWQFLKELLATPQTHGTAIRWLDRNRGVFKIEDSVRVARLWGRRKNRPAMNYDKLSRSIRQYYKKGIMKKTERSQRLVYQFCTPYSM